MVKFCAFMSFEKQSSDLFFGGTSADHCLSRASNFSRCSSTGGAFRDVLLAIFVILNPFRSFLGG